MKVLVVALTGVTNGGKTTIARNLRKLLPPETRLLQQDDYFLPEDHPSHITSPGGIKHLNWDVLSALDMDKMLMDIHRNIKQLADRQQSLSVHNPSVEDIDLFSSTDIKVFSAAVSSAKLCRPILLLEGFTILNDPRVRDLCELKVFVTLSRELCFERRNKRMYDPPDPPGYFEKCVWPMYEQHKHIVFQTCPDILVVDSASEFSSIFKIVFNRVLTTTSQP